MKLPPRTPKQQDILKLLYRYRFLNRIQIQSLMQHKGKRRIIAWLKDLREKHYVEWIYSTTFIEKTKPAIYYLGLNGIRLLRQQTSVAEDGDEYYDYPADELRKRYRESSRSRTYIDRCLLLADCCISLDMRNAAATDSPAVHYTYETEADYLDPDSTYHFLAESELIHPQLCYKKKERTAAGGTITTHCLLEIFDPTLPRYRMSKRLKDYVKYLDEEANEWREAAHTTKLPIIMLVCPHKIDLIYAKRRTRRLLEDIWDDTDRKKMHIRFATLDNVKKFGGMGRIWEEV